MGNEPAKHQAKEYREAKAEHPRRRNSTMSNRDSIRHRASRHGSAHNSPKHSPRPATSRSARRGSNVPSEQQSLDITGAHIILVRKLWRMARSSGTTEPGRSILNSVYHRNQDIRKLFHFSEDHGNSTTQLPQRRGSDNARNLLCVPGEQESTSLHRTRSLHQKRTQTASPDSHLKVEQTDSGPVTFSAHSRRFTGVLDKVMENLDGDLDALAMDLYDLGQRHAHLGLVHFKSKWWDDFAEAIIQESLQWGSRYQRSQATYETWSKIVLWTVEKIRDGYNDALNIMRRNSRNSHTPSPSRSPSSSFGSPHPITAAQPH